MDIDKQLANITHKEDLVSFIRDLPANSTGVLCFRVPSTEIDEDGDQVEYIQYRGYGDMTAGDAFLLCHEASDLARGR